MIVYRASELGSCSKYLIASRCGYDPTPGYGDDIPAFKQGHIIEAEVIEWLKQNGYAITEQQKELYLATGIRTDNEPVVVECHPDAIGKDKSGRDCVFEIKSAADDAYREFLGKGWEKSGGLFPRYLWQVSCYAAVTNLPVLFIVRNKEVNTEGRVIAREGGVGKTLMCMTDTYPPLYTLDQIRARIRKLEDQVEDYAIPEDCDYPNWLCPLPYLHNNPTQMVVDSKLDDLVREYVQIQKQIKDGNRKLNTQRLAIRDKVLKQIGVDRRWGGGSEHDGRIVVDTGMSRVTAVYGNTRYPAPDWDRMKKDGIDPNKYRRSERNGWKVRMTWRGEKSE